jgi:hypothetical protein
LVGFLTTLRTDEHVRLLNKINVFVHKQESYGFLKSLYHYSDTILEIEGYYRQISTISQSFNVS